MREFRVEGKSKALEICRLRNASTVNPGYLHPLESGAFSSWLHFMGEWAAIFNPVLKRAKAEHGVSTLTSCKLAQWMALSYSAIQFAWATLLDLHHKGPIGPSSPVGCSCLKQMGFLSTSKQPNKKERCILLVPPRASLCSGIPCIAIRTCDRCWKLSLNCYEEFSRNQVRK